MCIPKIIYYCWFGKDKPQKVLDCINNWREKLPDYEIVEINEDNRDLFDIENECKNNLWFKTVWENKMWAYVADYARLKVLYNNGGVYFDTDITVEKDITNLLEKNKLILGWEEEQSINIAIGIVTAENPLIKEMLDYYNNEIWHSKLYTIPQIVTHVIKKHYELNSSQEITENDDILIFPQEYFYPIPMGLKEKKDYITANTYVIHWWEGSWGVSNVMYFLQNKHKIDLKKLLKICFFEKKIINNYLIKISKKFKQYEIFIDFSYIFKFKNQYKGKSKFLTVIILGIQIPIWKYKNK